MTAGAQSSLTPKPISMGPIVVLIICVGAFLRFHDLGTESYWFDEVVMLNVTATIEGVIDTIELGRSPLLVLMGYFWTQVFGTSEAVVRFLPAFLGSLSLPVTFYIGRQLYDFRVALIATILMMISGFHIYHSQDFRYYSLFLFMTVASYYFYIQFLERGRRRHLILYIAYSVLTYYSHTYGVFVLVAQSVYFLLMWRKYRELRLTWFISQVLIFIGIFPHLWIFLTVQVGQDGADTGGAWLAARRNQGPLQTMVKFLFYSFSYLRPIPFIAAGCIFVAGVLSVPLRRGRTYWLDMLKRLPSDVWRAAVEKRANVILVVCWFAFTLLTPAILTLVYKPMYHERYVISASPAYYLLIGLALVTLGRVIPVAASVGALLAIMLPGLLTYYAEPTKEQWREAAAYVQANASEDDVLVMSYPEDEGGLLDATDAAFDWYYRGDLARCRLVDNQIGDEAVVNTFADCISGHNQIWVVARELDDPARRSAHIIGFFETLFPDGTYDVTQIDYYGSPVYRFDVKGSELAMQP